MLFADLLLARLDRLSGSDPTNLIMIYPIGPDGFAWIHSDGFAPPLLLICGCSRYAGRTDPHSVRTWGWVTSETAARQKFIGIQYFVAPSSTSVQGLSDMGEDTTGVTRFFIFFVSFTNDANCMTH